MELVEESRKQPLGKTPISRHPLFPATIALWFGALLGLGSLAVGPSALGSFVTATRIDSIVPAAAPPLGITARILLALAMAGIGGVIGAGLARRFARPTVEPRQRRRTTGASAGASTGVLGALMRSDYADDASADTYGNEPALAAPVLAPGLKRRALALSEEPAAPEVHEAAPLPGGDPEPQALTIAADEAEAPLDLELEASTPLALPTTEEAPDASAPPAQPVAQPAAWALSPHSAAERIATAPLDELAPVELVERLAIALEHRRARVAEALAAKDTSITATPMTPAPAATVAPGDAPHPQDDPQPDPAPATQPLPAMPAALRSLILEEPEEEDDHADLAFMLPPRGLSAPAGQRDDDIAADETDEDDETRVLEEGYSSLLGLSRPAQTRSGFIRIEEEDAASTGDAIEPVVIFPGQSTRPSPSPEPEATEAETPEPESDRRDQPRDAPDMAQRPFDNPNRPAAPAATPREPDEAERALRAALMTLQRMSGAA